MKAIYKYPLTIHDSLELELPDGAKILGVQTQNETPCIWAIVDNTVPTVKRYFRIFGTGHQLPENTNNLIYIGTFQLRSGLLVFHLFEGQEVQ